MSARTTHPALLRQELFLALASSMGDLVFLLDEKRRITFANRAACELSGYKEKALLGSKITVLCRKGLDQKYSAAIQSGIHAKGRWRGEMELSAKGGTSLWIDMSVEALRDASGAVVGSLCVGRDLRTERRHSQRSWEKSDQLLSICESMDDGIAVCDAKGTILMCNASFARQLGYSNDEVVGSSLPYAWTDGASAQKLKAAFRLFAKERSLKNHLVSYRRKSGASMVVSLAFSALRKGNAPTPNVVVTMRDVTDVQYAQDARRASDQLYRLQQDVQRKAQRLQTLQDINAFVLNSADTERIFKSITDGIKSLVGHDLAGIYLYDPGKEMFFAHTLSKKTAFSRKLAKFPLKMGEGIIGTAALAGKMVWVNNAQLDPRSRYPEGMRPDREHFIAVPLQGRESIFGILVVARNRDPEFIEEEALIVRSFADAATVALENAQMHHALGGAQGARRTASRRSGGSALRSLKDSPAPSKPPGNAVEARTPPAAPGR